MPGTFIFKPIEANLTHDTDWIGKMDPYCIYLANNKRIKGSVCKDGGKHPIWNDSTSVSFDDDQPACVVELMDKEKILPDDSIGTFVVDLKEIRNKGSVSRWYPVYHRNKPAGEILFEAAYQQDSGQAQNQGVLAAAPISTYTTPLLVAAPVIATTTYYEKTEKVIPAEGMTHMPKSHFAQGSSQGMYNETHNFAQSGSLEDPLYGKTIEVTPVTNMSSGQYSKMSSQGWSQSNMSNQGLQQDPLLMNQGLNRQQDPLLMNQGLNRQQDPLLNQGSNRQQDPLLMNQGSNSQQDPLLMNQGSNRQQDPLLNQRRDRDPLLNPTVGTQNPGGDNPGNYMGGFSQTNALNQQNQQNNPYNPY